MYQPNHNKYLVFNGNMVQFYHFFIKTLLYYNSHYRTTVEEKNNSMDQRMSTSLGIY